MRSYPILDLIRRRVRILPSNSNSIHRFLFLQVNNDPLRMKSITFASEFACEIWVTLPVGQVRALHRAVATGSKSTMWKRIGEDVLDRIFQFRAAAKVAAAVGRIAPGAILCPVPGAHAQLGVVAISNRSPSSRESFLHNVRRIHAININA